MIFVRWDCFLFCIILNGGELMRLDDSICFEFDIYFLVIGIMVGRLSYGFLGRMCWNFGVVGRDIRVVMRG